MNPGLNNRVVICFAASDHIGSKVLRWVFQSPVSHAFIMYHSHEWDCWEAIQVNQHRVHKVFARKIIKERMYSDVKIFEAKYNLWAGLVSKRYFIGRAYDWKGVFVGLLKGLLQRFLKIRIKELVHSGDALFCSEYVAEVIQATPGERKLDLLATHSSEMAPLMLLQHCKSSPELYKELDWDEFERKVLMGY